MSDLVAIPPITMTPLSPTYAPADIETHWQQAWAAQKTFAAPTVPDAAAAKFYVLEMFPYPSGDMHMGHVRNYSIGDVFARFARMQGACVLHPMGWDALGLPAENQAIAEKVAPQVRTPKNIARMKEQAVALGLAYDWQREIATYLPEYYRWNQWFFIKLFERDLVYRRRSRVNFCPGCDTVLANEQVRDNNVCWRGHPGVTQRTISEWAFRITAYADELLAGLEGLSQWPDRVVSQQRHWLGKSLGAHVRFPVHPALPDTAAAHAAPDKPAAPAAHAAPNKPAAPATHAAPDRPNAAACVEIFTTRIDTLYGCTYLVLAPEHPLVEQVCTEECRPAATAFVQRMAQTDRVSRTAEGGKKEGVFTGAYALHPLTQERLPIWLANFVLGDYGTGAVMGVPAHDVRDHAFARQYHLPIRAVVGPAHSDPAAKLPFVADGVLMDSGAFTGLDSATARAAMATSAEEKNFGAATVTWHLRDWGFSRQRYWGTPIPIVHCTACGAVPVPLADLPLRLPDFSEVSLTGEGGAPLGRLRSFTDTRCPTCGGAAQREVDTMDTFVDSAWYFARYLSPQLQTAPFARDAADAWLPVDVYVGGPEHAVMHLLYFRFFTRAMRDLGLLQIDEPVRRLITQGMVNARAFRCPAHGYLPAKDLNNVAAEAWQCPTCQEPLSVGIEKMSKSKYNGVDPLHLIARYGADTARLYTLFAAPPEKDLEWNADGVEGVYRFLQRVWKILVAQAGRFDAAPLPTQMQGLAPACTAARRAVHRTLAKVTEELTGRNHFNTAIAALMELCNALYELRLHAADTDVSPPVAREAVQIFAQMLAPFAPHLAETLWAASGGTKLVATSRWPSHDPQALVDSTVRIGVQVNGKLRGQLELPVGADAAAAAQAALAEASVQRHLEGKRIRKQIFVAGRLLNFVVSDA
jgi:leucyl-tRNA synthetase